MRIEHAKGKFPWYCIISHYSSIKVLWIGNWRLYYGRGRG